MIRIEVQKIDFSTANSITRDKTSLENSINQFIKNPTVIPQKTDVIQFTNGGSTYFAAILDYNIKQGG